jgi:hypothetical protein
MSRTKKMPGKRVQFDEETWEAIEAVMRDSRSSFQELTNEAFADLLKNHKQPVGLKASLREKCRQGSKGTSEKEGPLEKPRLVWWPRRDTV